MQSNTTADHPTVSGQLSLHKKVAAVVFLVCVVFLQVLAIISPLQQSLFIFTSQQHQQKDHHPTASFSFYGYESLEEMNERALRFPSVLERVHSYMSSHWFHPPCNSNDRILYRPQNETVRIREAFTNHSSRWFLLDSSTTLRKIHAIQRDTIVSTQCNSEYCQDLLQFWFPVVDNLGDQLDPTLPFLFQFSDEEVSIAFEPGSGKNISYPNLPHVKKIRLSVRLNTGSHDDSSTSYCSSRNRLGVARVQPIIYKLKTNRHYGMLDKIPSNDIPWSEKQNKAIFRGTLTGFLPRTSQFSVSTRSSNATLLSNTAARSKCLELPRCRLVYGVQQLYRNTTTADQLVDARLVPPQLQHIDIPNIIDSVALFGDRMTKQVYKAVVILEGNDVATGLKWALYSNSVVLAPAEPRFTSWAMEERLIPWHHFIPLEMNNLAADVHSKMQWLLEHDAEAQQIAHQGALWIRDLWIHPQASSDDEEITKQIILRYAAHFQRVAGDDDLRILTYDEV